MKKLAELDEVFSRVSDGAAIMIGGFMGVGAPERLIDGLISRGFQDLTVIAGDTAFVDKGVGKLIVAKVVKKLIASHIGTNPETGRQMNAGEIEVELVPQGTLVERMRAAGAGLGGVLTPTGKGTAVETGKQIIKIAGKDYLLEMPRKADIAFIKAHKADTKGNLVFRGSSRNYNPVMAMAADFVVVEAEQCVEAGKIPPDEVMLPGIFVDKIVQSQAM